MSKERDPGESVNQSIKNLEVWCVHIVLNMWDLLWQPPPQKKNSDTKINQKTQKKLICTAFGFPTL